ncbi:MAG: VRR-NUC domain-containing protein [Candidatus Cloacimonetes bacterium]|nr:VRR-NUC domain-containing protein [Candidatus Cloacimonadota bacterium]
MIPIPEDYELQALDTIPIKKPEAKQQARLVAALRRTWGFLHPLDRPIVFHVPNGGGRDPKEACNLRTQGVLAGMPDLIILAPGPFTVFIEMKAEGGRVSPEQRVIHPHIAGLGYVMLVAFSAEEALAQLRKLEWKN